jgi:hypothetical protein
MKVTLPAPAALCPPPPGPLSRSPPLLPPAGVRGHITREGTERRQRRAVRGGPLARVATPGREASRGDLGGPDDLAARCRWMSISTPRWRWSRSYDANSKEVA